MKLDYGNFSFQFFQFCRNRESMAQTLCILLPSEKLKKLKCETGAYSLQFGL